MPKLPPVWDALIDHVEAKEAPFSCAVIDGLPFLSSAPIPSEPTLAPLAEVLRSNAELPREIRDWLADMMTAGSGATCSMSISRNKKGRPPASAARYIEAVEHFNELRDSGIPHKIALDRTEKEFGTKRTTILAYRVKLAEFGSRSD